MASLKPTLRHAPLAAAHAATASWVRGEVAQRVRAALTALPRLILKPPGWRGFPPLLSLPVTAPPAALSLRSSSARVARRLSFYSG